MYLSLNRKRLSSEVLRVIDLAAEEALISGSDLSYASHLLVTILAEGESQSAEILRERGRTIRFVREYFRRHSYDYVQLPSENIVLDCYKRWLSFSPVLLLMKELIPDFVVRDEIQDVLDRSLWLLDKNQALSAGVVLLSMLRNPRTGVSKFFRELDVDVEELDNCLSQLEPPELRKLSFSEKCLCFIFQSRYE